MLRHVGVPAAPPEPPSEPRHRHADADGHRGAQYRGTISEPAPKDWILDQHLAGDVPEQAAAEPDDPRVAVHEQRQEPGAPDDDRQREPDPEHHQEKIPVRRRRDRQHVVEAHRDVGDDDYPDRLPERRAASDLAGAGRCRPDEPDGDPDEEQPTHELQERDPQEHAHDADEDQPQEDRADRAPDLPQDPLALGQGAHRERDDEGVVAREKEIQHADAEQSHPELRIDQERHQAPRGDVPRSRRHHGVTIGSTKKKMATAVITPAIGRDTKIASEPWDMIRLWRNAFSARSPSTSASTSGASG